MEKVARIDNNILINSLSLALDDNSSDRGDGEREI